MAIALDAYRERARTEFPGLELDLGAHSVRLLSVTELDDDQLDRFAEVQDQLSAADEKEDVRAVKAQFVEILAEVSDNPSVVREVLSGEKLGTLLMIFRDYASTISEEATKSGSAS